MVAPMKEIGIHLFLEQFSDSPSRLAWVEAFLSEEDTVRAFTAAVDDSVYGLRDWVDALIVLGQWMDARGLRAPFEDQIGYVHCACEAAGAGANLTPLPALVTEMLENYGFAAAGH